MRGDAGTPRPLGRPRGHSQSRQARLAHPPEARVGDRSARPQERPVPGLFRRHDGDHGRVPRHRSRGAAGVDGTPHRALRGPWRKRGKDILEVPRTLLVNPSFEVLDPTEEEEFEACLSVPFLAAKVPRPKKIRVSALDTSGKTVSFVAEDFHARVVLHESDHLDGVVYLCLLYTSDAADDLLCVDLGGRRIIN